MAGRAFRYLGRPDGPGYGSVAEPGGYRNWLVGRASSPAQELLRGLWIDQRVNVKFRRDHVLPFVEPRMQHLVRWNVEQDNGPSADPCMDEPNLASGLQRIDPLPEPLPRCDHAARPFGAWVADYQKEHRADMRWPGDSAPLPGSSQPNNIQGDAHRTRPARSRPQSYGTRP